MISLLKNTKAFFDSILILWIVLCAVFLLSKNTYAQISNEDDFQTEDLVLAVVAQGKVLSAGIFAVQQNGRYYVPIGELSEILSFQTDISLNDRTASGWVLDEDRTFEIDAPNNELVYRDKKVPLPSNAVLDAQIADDDLYILLEVMNEIWPMTMNIDLEVLGLFINPDEDLPFAQLLERKKRQERMLERKEEKTAEAENAENYPFLVYPYQAFGRPSVDVQARFGYDATQDDTRGNVVVTGVQDLFYASADYSGTLAYADGDLVEPENIRLRFRRQDIHGSALPLGLKDVQAGDVTLTNRRLIDNNLRGRGLTFTNSKEKFSNEFDLITIDGIGTPGYEVELYVNNQLIAFTDVDDSGYYSFEEVQITYGNNRLRTVLYGPQGQIEERVESYFYNANMVQEGKYEFSGGIIDARKDLIPIDERPENRPTGLAANLYGAYGVSQRLTAFASGSIVPDDELTGNDDTTREYLSAGAIATFPTTIAQLEAFKQMDGGEAVDLRTVSDFMGFKVSLRGAAFRDFISPESTISNSPKELELEANIRRAIPTPIGNLGLELGADYEEREDGSTRSTYVTRQSLGVLGTRLTNRTRSSYTDGDHNTTTADFSTTSRFNKWRLRNSVNYRLHPEVDVSNISADLRYGNLNEYSYGLNLQRNFDARETRLSAQVTKDFEKFLGSIEANVSTENGAGFLVRASTAFGPYDQDGSYLMQSDPLRTAGPISAFVYRDENYDGVFNEGDEPLENTKIKIGRRVTKDETDENGYIAQMNTVYVGRKADVSVDSGSIDDPYLVAADPGGYKVFPRPGVIQTLEFPVVNTGAIDGTIRWANDARPIGGLDIQLMNENGDIVSESTTAQDGYYTFERIPPGRYTIRANPASGLNIPFEYVELVPDDLFKFGVDIEPVDLNRPMMVDLDVGIDADASLNAKNILSIAKGFKSTGKGLPTQVQPRAKIHPAVQRANNIAPSDVSIPKTESVKLTAPKQKMGMSVLDKISARINQPDSPVEIQQIQVSETSEMVRISMDMNAPVEYSISYDPNTSSVFVEMPYATWLADKSWQSGGDDMILKGFNVESVSTTGIRLNMALAKDSTVSASGLLAANGVEKDRLYIDIVKK